MATTYSLLGQVADASAEVVAYTAPANKNVKIKITVANRAATSATFRVALLQDGTTTGDEDYIAYDKLITANDSVTSVTFTMNASDSVTVMSSTATVTFLVYGIEQDQ